ncbi:hypothetical protein [Candidatus Sororendozoicomonas aggregata]
MNAIKTTHQLTTRGEQLSQTKDDRKHSPSHTIVSETYQPGGLTRY